MAADPLIMPGCAAALYFNIGAWGSPTWVNQTSLRDVEPTSGWKFGEALTREMPVTLNAKMTLDLNVTAQIRADPLDAIFTAWVFLHWDRTEIQDTMILNATLAINGACGWRAPYLYSMVEGPQNIDSIIYQKFELRPTIDANGDLPVSVEVGANSSCTFSNITY